MLSKSLLTWAALAAPLCNANPIVSPPVVHVERSYSDLALREAMNMAARDASLQKRVDTTVDLAKSLDDYTIFKGSWAESVDGINNSVSAKLTCVECYTTGAVSASILDDILNPTLRLDFEGVEAYVDLEVAVSDTATYTYTIFSTDTPVGVSIGDVSLGLVFYVDIVLSLSAEVDLEGGFAVQVANGSYIEADILKGDISSSLFTGTTVQAVPITIVSGEATLKADLRLRVEAGASADILGVGINAELGIYANILEFIVEAESTAACDVLLLETWDINAGAFLDADVVVDYSTFGAVPTVSTTLYQGPTATQCLGAVSSSSSSSSSSAITAAVTSLSVARVVVGAEVVSSVASSASSAVSASGSAGLAHLFTNATVSASSFLTSASASAVVAAAAGSNGTTLTSTIFATSTYTITSCAASVVNCPATLQNKIIVTEVVTSTVAICPEASTTITLPASSTANTVPVSKTTTSSAAAATGTMVVVTDVYVLVPCETPIVATFTAPTSVASVSIVVLGAVTPSSSAYVSASATVSAASASAVIEKETETVVPVLSTTGGAFYGNSSTAKAVLAVGQVGSTAVVLPTGSLASAGVAAASSAAIVKIAAASASSSGAASPTSSSAQSAVTAAAGRVVSGSFASVLGAVVGALILL